MKIKSKPDAFHPGEHLKDEITARNIKQGELAKSLNLSKSEMSLIINGKRNITVPLAAKIEEVLGIDAEFWLNLQASWDLSVFRNKQ